MNHILIKNDRYSLIIYGNVDNWATFTISDFAEGATRIRVTIILPENTTPEAWLLGLAAGMIVRDREGKRIRMEHDNISFDIDMLDIVIPMLPFCYYGFTKDQIANAIKSALAPEPEVDWPDWVKDGAKLEYCYNWCDWILRWKHYNIRLEQIEQVTTLPLLTDHLDKTKVYAKEQAK